jgi:hypothetical protein
MRAVTGSAVAATGAAVTQLTGRALATVAAVVEPVLPAAGPLLRQVDDTISTTTAGLVGTVDQVLALPRSLGSNGPTLPPPPAERKRKATPPASRAADLVTAPPGALDSTPIIHRGSPPRVGAREGGTAVPSLAPPARSVAPSTGSSSAGGASGFAFVGFAIVAGLFVLAAPGLGRRLKLWPALIRPLAFVSPPERPG